MKSGYSTKILVHKEGIMTNEEIFQLADKALKNQEKRFNSIIIGTAILMLIGFLVMFYTIDLTDIIWGQLLVAVFAFINLFIYFVCITKYADKYAKIRREFTYNLVRKDERMRIKNGTF